MEGVMTREDMYLAYLSGEGTELPEPMTRNEEFLYNLCMSGYGAPSQEQVSTALESYLQRNPIEPGATTEEAAQIQANKDAVETIKNNDEKQDAKIQEHTTAIEQLQKNGTGTGTGTGSGGNVDWLDPEDGEVFTVIVPEPTLTGISASYTGGDVLIGTALSALVGIVVTATYSDGTTKTVTDYTLSGEIAEGSNTITVTYEDMTTTFTVTGVEEVPEVTLSSISATYTGGNVAVGTAVTALTGITVTAHYSDGSTATVTDYTLSGEIAEGSNTITVSYGGMTATFEVTGEAENTDPVEYPVYLETIDGVEYIITPDRSLARANSGSEAWLNANSYKNDTYTCYTVQVPCYTTLLNRAITEPYGGVIPFAEGTETTGGVLLYYAEEGEYCGGPNKGWWRLYNDFGEYENVYDYYWGKYGVLKLALVDGLTKKTIDPSLITSINIKQNDDVWQYAQFDYSDLPESNIYYGFNTLTFSTGSNMNLSNESRTAAVLGTTKLSIKFKPGTFADFTLDAVKEFLNEHPLTFIY